MSSDVCHVSGSVHVRLATPADTETIVDFNARIAEETEGRSLPLETLKKGVTTALADPQHCQYFVAEFDGRVIGQAMITYEWSDWRNGRFWWIQSVYVTQDWRRRGIFRLLYQYLQRLAKDTPECCGLRLYVEQHNLTAQETYRKLGMQATGYLILEEDWSSPADA